MAIKLLRIDTVDTIPSTGGATDEWALGYMSADMTRITTWDGDTLGSATVVASWPLKGSLLSDRAYHVDATIGGAEYRGRTYGPNMLWRGRTKRTQFSDRPEGRARRRDRRVVRAVKCGEIG